MTWRDDGTCSDNPRWDADPIPTRLADCRGCEVRAECLTAGLHDVRENPLTYRNFPDVIWGGKTSRELLALAKVRDRR